MLHIPRVKATSANGSGAAELSHFRPGAERAGGNASESGGGVSEAVGAKNREAAKNERENEEKEKEGRLLGKGYR